MGDSRTRAWIRESSAAARTAIAAPIDRPHSIGSRGRARPGDKGVEPDPDVAGLASSERGESTAAAAVTAQVEGGHIPPRLVERGHALSLHGTGGFREAVEQKRCPSRVSTRHGMPRARQLHAVSGKGRDRPGSIHRIAGGFACALEQVFRRKPRPGRHDQGPGAVLDDCQQAQAMTPSRKPARLMTMRSAVSWSTHGLDSSKAKTRREQAPSPVGQVGSERQPWRSRNP